MWVHTIKTMKIYHASKLSASLFLCALVLGASSCGSTTPKTCATGGSCQVGDIGPGTGRVIYDAGVPQQWGQYIEVAPSDLQGAEWCDKSNTTVPNARAVDLGDGAANTAAMNESCTTGISIEVSRYDAGGKNDWVVPSKAELDQIWQYAKIVNNLKQDAYWSSTELEVTIANYQFMAAESFRDSRGGPYVKSGKFLTRPVRLFGPINK